MIKNMIIAYEKIDEELTLEFTGRITADNALDIEKKIFDVLEKETPKKLVLNAENLIYISSSGLRILMKLVKKYPKLSVINVSSDVAEIFEMTGLNRIMEVKQALREISVEGKQLIGKGQNGEVYRLDKDTIVKLYPADKNGFKNVEQEKKNAKEALVLGIPTALSFDITKVGENIGLVFELVDAKSMREVVAKDPENMEEIVTKAANLSKTLRKIEVPQGVFPDMSEVYKTRAKSLSDWLTEDEINLLLLMTDSIPKRNTYIHGDFHRGNIMAQGDELILIDMADSAVGHPIYDVLSVYMLGKRLTEVLPEAVVKKIVGWDVATVCREWEIFSRVYFDTKDEDKLKEINALMDAYCRLRELTFLKIAPVNDEYRKKQVAAARAEFFPKIKEHIARFDEFLKVM